MYLCQCESDEFQSFFHLKFLGSVASLDDFYLTSAGIATTETTLFIYNKEMYKNLTNSEVYEPIRVAVANRLSEHGSQWANYFKRNNRYSFRG